MTQPQIHFVCSAARMRSRAAELLSFIGGYARDDNNGHKTIYLCRSAGTDPNCPAPVTNNGMLDAEIVVCMEQEHAEFVGQFQAARQVKIVTLGIPDRFHSFEKELVIRLVARLRDHDLAAVADAIERGYKVYRQNVF